MMRSKLKLILLAAIVPAVLFYACKKYEDPARPDIGNGLDGRYYCNDPIAINYNWNFPGHPDNTKCIYPVDSFLGTWAFKDYVLLPNGDTDAVVDRMLTFVSTEDSIERHLAVTGWCTGNTPFYLTATKYGKAEVDTLPGGSPGQFLCVTTDTLNGKFLKSAYQSGDSMKVDLSVSDVDGIKYHKGIAIKQ
jgi:hypothetical protein